MQLGFSTWAMPDRPMAEQIAIVREAGYSAIEIISRIGSGVFDARKVDGEARQRLRRLFDDAGLALVSLVAHANLLGTDPERHAAERAHVEAAIDLAAGLTGKEGTPCVVTMAYGKPDAYEQIRDTVAENFASLARYATPRGVVVALEPHVGQAFDRPARVKWLMDQVDSPHFRLNFDNSHFEVMGYGIDDYIPLLTPYAVHTHLKDQRGVSPNYEFLVPGEGDFDYPRYLKAMDDADYSGAITVEISKQVQVRPDYDPAEVAQRSFKTLTSAATNAGIAFDRR
jgi:sugar phosphate isomerase/epimerase